MRVCRWVSSVSAAEHAAGAGAARRRAGLRRLDRLEDDARWGASVAAALAAAARDSYLVVAADCFIFAHQLRRSGMYAINQSIIFL